MKENNLTKQPMNKHIEILEIVTNRIGIVIEINYIKGKVSIVEYKDGDYYPKKFLFSERSLEYLNGWKEVLEAIKKAIEYGEERLKELENEQFKETVDFFEYDEKQKKKNAPQAEITSVPGAPFVKYAQSLTLLKFVQKEYNL